MPILIFTAILIILIFLIDGIPLIKKKQKAELTVFFLLIALSCILVIFKNTGMPITLKSLNDIFNEIGKKLFGSG